MERMEDGSQSQVNTLRQLKESLLLSYAQCSFRGLLHGANWAADLACCLDVEIDSVPALSHSPQLIQEFCSYCLGKSLYDKKEFRRAAHVLRNCQSNEGVFLRLYSLYLAGEKRLSDEEVEVIGEEPKTAVNPELLDIKRELMERKEKNLLDGFGFYLLGVVLRKLELKNEACEVLIKACHLVPLLWPAWQELAKLCEDREQLYSFSLPNHWMKDLFLAAGSLELMLLADAMAYYAHLRKIGFTSSSYVNSQVALVHYHSKDFDQSAAEFGVLRKLDPYCLDSVDVFSHVLFVMEMLPELTELAQHVNEIDPYRSETCSVIGNFYSLRGDHLRAIVYFQRGVRLNKHDHTAWILLGHEYIQLKNHTMAIEAYAHALEINKHDFRSYYGLGLAYELLRMPYFSLHYYKLANSIRPSDSRILYALGWCYDQLEQFDEAKKCYKRAIAFHDQEGTSIIKLAKLHMRLEEADEAAKLFKKFVIQAETSEAGVHHPEEQGPSHLFLARYHMRRSQFGDAEAHAHKATEFRETREEAKSLLQEINRRRVLCQDTALHTVSTLTLEQEISPIPTTVTTTTITAPRPP